MNRRKTALALGSFVALAHLVWVILVGLNLANPWMSWVLRLHFLNNPFTFQPFDYATAIVLIVMAFIVGYVVGWVFAAVWDWVNKKK
jgi:hypothetical protein